MNVIFFIVLQIVFSNNTFNLSEMEPKQVSKNGMTVKWIVLDNYIQFTLQSPKHGWVAIGINEEATLINSNLIMANVENNSPRISDRFVVSLGNHKAVTDLGGEKCVALINGNQSSEGTSITFNIKKHSGDNFHYQLREGQAYYLTMAYSLADDFQHHSIMRTATKIIL